MGGDASVKKAKKQTIVDILRQIPTLVMLCLMVAGLIFSLRNGVPDTDAFLRRYGITRPVAALLILALYAVKGSTGALLYGAIAAACGRIFPLPMALLINTFGTVLNFSISYAVGRFSKREKTVRRIRDRLRENKKLGKYLPEGETPGFALCFVLRVLGLQSEVLGLLFGTCGLLYLPFIAASILGNASSMISYTVLGRNMDPFSPAVLVCFGIDFFILLVTWLIYRYVQRKKGDAPAAQSTPGGQTPLAPQEGDTPAEGAPKEP